MALGLTRRFVTAYRQERVEDLASGIRKIVRRIWARLTIDDCVTDCFQQTPKHKNLWKTTSSIEKRIEAKWGHLRYRI